MKERRPRMAVGILLSSFRVNILGAERWSWGVLIGYRVEWSSHRAWHHREFHEVGHQRPVLADGCDREIGKVVVSKSSNSSKKESTTDLQSALYGNRFPSAEKACVESFWAHKLVPRFGKHPRLSERSPKLSDLHGVYIDIGCCRSGAY
jgi:hypothetical protein